MQRSRFGFATAMLPVLLCAPALGIHAQSTPQVQNINISFNGPSTQFPYTDQFFSATNAYYRSIGRNAMPGNRHCHAYLSWDIAQQPVGAGPSGTEGSRAWFEDWLAAAQGHCDRALITFKYVSGVTQISGYPTVQAYGSAITDFLNTSWSYTGWTGAFDFTPWNEPNNGAGSGDGLSVQIPARTAADYYLIFRKNCIPSGCVVAAGDFGSNGTMWQDFVQNCSNDLASTLCSNASYMDAYKHWLAFDTVNYNLPSSFRPEIFAYHGWDDINNYINTGSQCTDPDRCTIRAFTTALSGDTWTGSTFWDTEVGSGQNPQSNPTATQQACAAAFLLNLTANVTTRFARIYYTKAYEADGQYWSLFDSSGNAKPAFTVLANRDVSYTPPAGSSCP